MNNPGYVIGVDEAGYGPNLGPLVISATVWCWPRPAAEPDFYGLLGDFIAAEPAPRRVPERLVMADSKRLYKAGGGLGLLERGVLAALGACGGWPPTWRSAFERLDPSCMAAMNRIPWYGDYDVPLPREEPPDRIERLADRLQDALARCGVELCGMHSRVVFPEQFNQLLETLGGKGALLSTLTLDLIKPLIEGLGDGPLLLQCDKHGGRNKYQALLQQMVPDQLVQVLRESRDISLYRWGPAEARVEARFVARGERFLPSALASMTCKYLRELAMQAFNAFWRRHAAGLQPTAGYPQDARRFERETRDLRQALGVSDRVFWRNR